MDDDDVLATWHNAMAAMGAVPVTVDYDVRGPTTVSFRPAHVVSAGLISDGIEIVIVTTVWTPAATNGYYEAVTQIAYRGCVRTSREAWGRCDAAVAGALRGAFINAGVCLRCAHLLEQHEVDDDNAVRCHCGCGCFKA